MTSSSIDVKIKVSPRGVVKVSHGVSVRRPVSPASVFAPDPSPLVNRSELQETDTRLGCDFPVSSDCPMWSPSVGWGLLGNKDCMSKKTSVGLADRMAAQELHHGRDRLLFCTFTLPQESVEAYEALARWSGYAVNHLSQYLRDSLGTENHTRTGVWEYQKRGALHYHLCLGLNADIDNKALCTYRQNLANAWMRCLLGIQSDSYVQMIKPEYLKNGGDRLLDYDDLGQRFCNVQKVEKSVVAYLSQYLTESNHSKDKQGLRSQYYPIGTWAQWCRESTALMKKYSVEYSTQLDASGFPDWEVLCRCLFDSLDMAEGTKEKCTYNGFYHSMTRIVPSDSRLSVLDLVRDWVHDLRVSGLECSLWYGLRLTSKRKYDKQWEIRQAHHELRLNEFCAMQEQVNAYAVPLYWDLVGLMQLMTQCRLEISRNGWGDSRYPEYVQLSLIESSA
jgi:hypothetical protein